MPTSSAGCWRRFPRKLVDRVRLIDLADESAFPGINLLDTRVFSDRDRTADSVVRVARGLWEQWGPRMPSILEQSVKTLHEANALLEPEDQYTILDGLRLLSDEGFRGNVLACVEDQYLLDWWARDFGGWRREYRAEALAPVQTRLSYYASSKRARAILGQSRSTIDLRRTILDGGVLLVSTAQGTAGRDVAALVGASLLNLVDGVIREQEGLPLEQRRGALVVVDEMQSMPGVDYESMLSELGKYGASFVLATQSLAKLADLSPTMQDTLLANVGCLCVFQVAGSDARHLVGELGRERVTDEDITSLPVHHCYVRATVGHRAPAGVLDAGAEAGAGRSGGRVPHSCRFGRLQHVRHGDRRQGRARAGAGSRRTAKGCRRLPTPRRMGRRHREPVRLRRSAPAPAGGNPLRPTGSTSPPSRGGRPAAVYDAVASLEGSGLVDGLPHATDVVPRTRRFSLTADGVLRLAWEEGLTTERLLRTRPLSAHWRRLLLARLDGGRVRLPTGRRRRWP